ncbi:MAG: glycerophosphodiester phosphodiesterase [Rubrivivax sp.]|nr:glycerophosphodiester phosphodiesterase [Rubrivivax sp.]
MKPGWALPFWIAHRGAGKLAPENTLAAFRVGAGYGYRAFECDVKLSADGVPFLLHDATLERTTPASGVAGHLPWAALSQLDAGAWHSRTYAGEPLPSLEAIAAYVRRNGCALNVEIKPTPGQEHATGVAVGAACSRLWPGPAPALLLSSFEPEALQGARESAPALPRALLLDCLSPGWLARALQLDCAAVVTHFTLMDAALVAQVHGAGLRALCYTVNDADQARRLLDLGVDGLITDAVDRFVPYGPTVLD